MAEPNKSLCPECQVEVDILEPVDRRDFMKVVGGGAAAAALLATGTVAAVPALAVPPAAAATTPRPGEELVRELFAGLTPAQRQRVVYPWDHRPASPNALPTRLGMYNQAIFPNHKVGQVYTPAQQNLVDQILHSISSGEEGYNQLSRLGTWDGSHSLQNCGAYIFGNPDQGQYSFVFAGHHLTVRCDGNSQPGAAFGGPMYYGHSPNGYAPQNCFNYQTVQVRQLFDALSAQQRQVAVRNGTPGELMPSVTFRPAGQPFPGLPATQLTHDQRTLVHQVMRTILSPYRLEDGDEVMEIIRRNGGLEQLHLAFYRDPGSNDEARWHFWRLEGPGFVWNYRILPHVHCYVNISSHV